MAQLAWEVEVFDVSDDNLSSPKFDTKASLSIVHEPDSVILKFQTGDNSVYSVCVTTTTECSRVASKSYVVNVDVEKSILIKFHTSEDVHKFSSVIAELKSGKRNSLFAMRTEDSSATQYFQFYGYLAQQQNMLQDFVRTYTYQRAILGNLDDFKDKIVLDVGAGSGILSFFAVQAGARKVYAVEASTMACFAQKLVDSNSLSDTIRVISGKIEEIELPEKVDVIISEPMGYMLYNERMLETYLHAKKWLKPAGKMYPSRGDLHIVPFTDDSLYMEQYGKANFWFQTSFHGVNLSAIQTSAVKEYFRQPIVDTFDIRICMSKSIRHVINFPEAHETDLHTIDIPLNFNILESGSCHGLAFWFDVAFAGSQQMVWLSTGPTEPLTHWYQVRCLLEQPLLVKQGQVLTGRVLLVANKKQSYDVTIELSIEGTNQTSKNTLDLKNPYFRYTGSQAHLPPAVSNVSPSENYWNQLDAQGVRNAVNIVDDLASTGLGEVAMDTTQGIINNNMITNNLIALVDPGQMGEAAGGQMPETAGDQIPETAGMQLSEAAGIQIPEVAGVQQPNIHPGSISSTGRGRVAASPTSTHTTQLIGGAISPSLFTQTNNIHQPLVMTNYPVSANLMIGDYVTLGNGVSMPTYRQ